MSDGFATAMELLLGERPSLEDVQSAAALLEADSAQGHADASERLALLETLGSTRPPDWDRALDLLALAAGRGSRRAQDQLMLLADDQSDPEPPPNPEAGFWDSLRKSIRLEDRMKPGDKASLSETPRIRVIKRFATGPECRWLISLARPRLAPAPVFDKVTGEQTHHAARDNSFFTLGLAEMNVFSEVIRNRISAATNLPVPLFEPSQVLHYAVGQRFKPHYDYLDPENPAYHQSLGDFGQRIATFLIYLNGGYGGGETSFPAISLNFHADEGDALFFANVGRDGTPDRKTIHAGLPPTSGEKWVFSQWIRDRFPGR